MKILPIGQVQWAAFDELASIQDAIEGVPEEPVMVPGSRHALVVRFLEKCVVRFLADHDAEDVSV